MIFIKIIIFAKLIVFIRFSSEDNISATVLLAISRAQCAHAHWRGSLEHDKISKHPFHNVLIVHASKQNEPHPLIHSGSFTSISWQPQTIKILISDWQHE